AKEEKINVMSAITAVLISEDESDQLVASLAANEAVDKIVLSDAQLDPRSGSRLNQLIEETKTDYLLLILPGGKVEIGPRAIERFLSVAHDRLAGWVYSDFRDDQNDHPLIDYQWGSIRDTFDFGSLVLISKRAAQEAIALHGIVSEEIRWGALYDLRLKLSIDSQIFRIPEPIYTRTPLDARASGERLFDYVDPRQRDYQIEMEHIATAHLKRAGAYLEPQFEAVTLGAESFPVRASVVIPVRNRERTIRDAATSALSQKTDFQFNVIVVDNHSTDRTTEILSELADKNARLVHLRPSRRDLGIGGCWNEAIYSEHCGQYAVQLDSDDLYKDEHTLAKIIAKFDEGYAMVIGSYSIVNFDLEEIPPGLIDHREWTRENGRNNALRINGLGAPRAFYVPVLRQTGFPNTSYGEDYAVALAVSRRYEIGRMYESIYFARRWEGNSDAALPLLTANRYDAYKDFLRTTEILARKKVNEG
ncbi:MAG TPA: glycosyltransferase family 2 protein, partial [Blastocatellia bacterium]